MGHGPVAPSGSAHDLQYEQTWNPSFGCLEIGPGVTPARCYRALPGARSGIGARKTCRLLVLPSDNGSTSSCIYAQQMSRQMVT